LKQALKHLSLFLLVAGAFAVTGSSAQKLLIPVPLAPPPANASPYGAVPPALLVAPEPPEPERWTKEDVTLEEQFSTLKKETMAAYQIEIDACKLENVMDQPQCLAQAKSGMEKEMSLIKARFGMYD
jgi:hypothetical protein